MKTYDPLNVLKPVARDVWMVDGPIITMDFPLGVKLPFPTRMVIVRLANGDLWVHSPIAADPGLIEVVRALGPVRHILASNSIHYWYVPDWAEMFPQARTYGPAGLERSAKRPIAIDRVFEETAAPEWQGAFDQLLFEGSVISEAIFLHRPSQTLIVSDLIENFEPGKVEERWLRLIMGVAGILDPKGSMPVDLRLTFWNNRKDILEKVERMLAWSPERVVMAHGRPYLENAHEELQRAFAWTRRLR